tara:strand:+ start:521 stop:811 length:291 start_codon:yes stop_codon:yes gene_type:complete
MCKCPPTTLSVNMKTNPQMNEPYTVILRDRAYRDIQYPARNIQSILLIFHARLGWKNIFNKFNILKLLGASVPNGWPHRFNETQSGNVPCLIAHMK